MGKEAPLDRSSDDWRDTLFYSVTIHSESCYFPRSVIQRLARSFILHKHNSGFYGPFPIFSPKFSTQSRTLLALAAFYCSLLSPHCALLPPPSRPPDLPSNLFPPYISTN